MYGINEPQVRETQQTPKRRRAMPKGRSSRTYQNKLRKITSFYNRLAKQNGTFKQKYPTLDSFLKVNPLKEPNVRK